MIKRIVAAAFTIGAIAAVSCGPSESTVPDIAPAPTTAPAVAPAPTAAPPQAAVVDVKTGTGIGDRAPEFEISLTDGTPVTSAGLIAEERPAFLFFFSTS